MQIIIIEIITIIILITLFIVYKIDIKKSKQMVQNTILDELTNKNPSNIEICKEILKKLNNEKVKVEEDTQAKASLYIAVSNKILIANVKNSFTRILTIAHECIHSTQNRRILLFNFIYSNIYILYFIITSILAIIKKLPNEMMFFNILILLSFVYYFVRAYLEDDAMIKSIYLAKEYMQEKNNILSNEKIDTIIKEYDIFNDLAIRTTNYMLLCNCMIKVIIFGLILIII